MIIKNNVRQCVIYLSCFRESWKC